MKTIIINNLANLPSSLLNPAEFAEDNRGWGRGLKPLCLCNIPVQMNREKWAIAINGQPPDASPNLSSFFDQARDKNRRKF